MISNGEKLLKKGVVPRLVQFTPDKHRHLNYSDANILMRLKFHKRSVVKFVSRSETL
jgi:hypothetical protein